MNKLYALIALMLAALTTACSNMSEKEIEQMTTSGVVLVQNESFYEVTLSNGESLYFSDYNEEEGISGIATELDSVQPATHYGTGFFVSEHGEIATNNHVVASTAREKDINKNVDQILEYLKSAIVEYYNELNSNYQQIAQARMYAMYDESVSVSDYNTLQQAEQQLASEMQECEAYYNALDNINTSQSEITYHNQISIAYNDTHVTSSTDFIQCVVTKTDAEHDLAIIQLKDKRTPEGHYIFQVGESDPLEDYTFKEKLIGKIKEDKNSRLFMTGFNLGPQLALTNEGIKSQFNSGAVSQRTADRIMYSIPALSGSSGSPVVNLQGQLVAINFAGINGTQGFNYGIRVKYLRQLLAS